MNWSPTDLVVAVALLGAAGASPFMAWRRTRWWSLRLGRASGAVGVWPVVWVGSAVGIVGEPDDAANRTGVLHTNVLGTVVDMREPVEAS